MKHLNNYYEFINEEFSKNDPIKELNQKDKLGIIVLGLPGAGKSTFIDKTIMTKNRNFKKFSTDSISLLKTGDPNEFYPKSTELNMSYLKQFIKTGNNFIFDTTGDNEENIFNVCDIATNSGYKIIFILILIDLETSKKQTKLRRELGGHGVDNDYIEGVYSRQLETTKNYLKNIKHENFYVVLNKGGKWKYHKHTGDKILTRKVDKYI